LVGSQNGFNLNTLGYYLREPTSGFDDISLIYDEAQAVFIP